MEVLDGPFQVLLFTFTENIAQTHEITTLTGNISTMKGKIYLHLHIAISDLNNNAFGGHLNSAIINTTGEINIEEIKGKIEKEFNEEVGLNLSFQ